MQARPPGQNLSEYSIGIALIVIVSIAAVGFIGANVSQMLSGSIGRNNQTISSAPPPAAGLPTPTGANIPFSNLPGKVVSITLNNGRTVTLNMADPVAVAEAAGPLGTTDNALAGLEQLIAQLEAQGEDPDIIESFRDLALSGQEIRKNQELLENAFKNRTFATYADYQAFLQTHQIVGADGSTKPLKEVIHFLQGQTAAGQLYESSFEAMDGQENTLVTRVQNIYRDPKLANSPVLKALVGDVLGREIYQSTLGSYQLTNMNISILDMNEKLSLYKNSVRDNSNTVCDFSYASNCYDRSQGAS